MKMSNIILENVLTDSERLRMVRLLDHDGLGVLVDLREVITRGLEGYEGTLKPEFRYMDAASLHTLLMIHAVNTLTEFNKIQLREVNLEKLVGCLQAVNHREVKMSLIEGSEKFIGCQELIYPILFNLTKNCFMRGYAKQAEVSSRVTGFPESALYIPDKARDYKEFVAVTVRDNGSGFSKDIDFLKRLTTCPEKGIMGGFGFYFTGIVSKILGAPVDMYSEARDTKITFYHPVYPR